MPQLLKTVGLFFMIINVAYAQQKDSLTKPTTFSGSIGFTNNGFSIIPSFSLNSPSAILTFVIKKERLSFEPDIRLVSDASKGGMLFWLKYQFVDKQKFKLKAGAHPAFSFVHRNVTENNVTTRITEMLRFFAFEIVPSYQITSHWGVSAVYFQGHGLQSHGPQTTRALFLNNVITNIPLSKTYQFHFFPTVFFFEFRQSLLG